MSVDIQGVIQAISRASESPRKAGGIPVGRRPIITISRTRGSGGNEIAANLGKRLGVDVFDKEVLNAIANHAGVNGKLMESLHEKVTAPSDAWLYAIVFGKSVTRNDYLHTLVTTIRGIYRIGGIVVGRGGHIILAGRQVLRVRVVGGIEACAKRIALRENMDLDAAKRHVRDHNLERGRFIWNTFGKRLNDPQTFDLMINTDGLTDYEQATDLVLRAAEHYGILSTAPAARPPA